MKRACLLLLLLLLADCSVPVDAVEDSAPVEQWVNACGVDHPESCPPCPGNELVRIAADLVTVLLDGEMCGQLRPQPQCGVTLTVDPIYLEQVDMVTEAARWEAAIGCPITFGEGGVPVTLERSILDKDGKEMWGNTWIHTVDGKYAWCNSIQVSFKSRDLQQTFGHELGHCLGALGGIDGGGHTADGILKAWHKPGDNNAINAEALELVCSSVRCVVMQPEE